MENVEKEKKGFFDFLKPKPKPMSNAELQGEIKIQNNAILVLKSEFEKLNENVKNNFEPLMKAIEELRLVQRVKRYYWEAWVKRRLLKYHYWVHEMEIFYLVEALYGKPQAYFRLKGIPLISEQVT